MLFDHQHANYAGDSGIGINPALGKEIREADLVVLLGGRYSEMPSATYSLLQSPYPKQKLVHVYPDPSELGRVYRPDLAICAAPEDFVAALDRAAGIALFAKRYREYAGSTVFPSLTDSYRALGIERSGVGLKFSDDGAARRLREAMTEALPLR